jgi:hypothetical protein
VPVPQIAVRLSIKTKTEFEQYAAHFGLTSSHLAKLLILRERHVRRLERLFSEGELPTRQRQLRGSGRRRHITAHVSSLTEQSEFDAYAAKCGLSRDGAGALLIESELTERWLERAVRTE